jgi:hypothetical protein
MTQRFRTARSLSSFLLVSLAICATPAARAASPERIPAPLQSRVAIHFLNEQLGDDPVAETDSFRIHHAGSRSLAEKVARLAERAKADAEEKWFGTAGEKWEPRCELFLHDDETEFCHATGLPQAIPGVSTTRLDGEHLVSRRADFCCTAPNWVSTVLPHEVTHVVVTGRFRERRLPPWANEGIAVLSEPRQRIGLHLRNLSRYRREGKLFRIEELMELPDYPRGELLGAFYAQSVSLVEFLADQKGAQAVTQFLRDGLRIGFPRSLMKHYGLSTDELDELWRRQTLGSKESARP